MEHYNLEQNFGICKPSHEEFFDCEFFLEQVKEHARFIVVHVVAKIYSDFEIQSIINLGFRDSDPVLTHVEKTEDGYSCSVFLRILKRDFPVEEFYFTLFAHDGRRISRSLPLSLHIEDILNEEEKMYSFLTKKAHKDIILVDFDKNLFIEKYEHVMRSHGLHISRELIVQLQTLSEINISKKYAYTFYTSRADQLKNILELFKNDHSLVHIVKIVVLVERGLDFKEQLYKEFESSEEIRNLSFIIDKIIAVNNQELNHIKHLFPLASKSQAQELKK